MADIRACLVGISGYAGMELARLLTMHPRIKLTMACSRTEAGRQLKDYYPFLSSFPAGEITISVYEAGRIANDCDLIFLAVPAGTSLAMTPELIASGLKVIDFSADFRLRQSGVYHQWYGMPHTAEDLLTRAVYGVPEIYGNQIEGACLVANPGCYPTASILALYAALKNNLVSVEDIIIDAKSGASGAGRKASVANLFCEISDNFRAYGLPTHRHTPEIEQELSKIAGRDLQIVFTPHILPMKRGILATIYARLKDPGLKIEAIQEIYEQEWKDLPWIRVLPKGQLPQTANVRGSMFCDIGLVKDERQGRLIILSAIDNLCRGASGQALANANLMCGLPVDTGMEQLAPMP